MEELTDDCVLMDAAVTLLGGFKASINSPVVLSVHKVSGCPNIKERFRKGK